MMEIQPEAKSIYLIDLDTSAQYDRKRKTPILFFKIKTAWKIENMRQRYQVSFTKHDFWTST